ncbi:M20/M25/M40 family metallo-hydrolase [Phenylobacterium sp. 20VBR1]|uniref:Vacuolar membrane protease n=1 Tax=Phenylobacterium glaciei TaxID=2803784 RepID=A0A941CYD8_9CAUL|nr:M20/M25/M40 family metallo-hydrolase [Phenylobacterium glaciei]MBR7618921.1 M20/M25/M40 family metallo-hydrolase [Phenylobacterium glaciei]
MRKDILVAIVFGVALLAAAVANMTPKPLGVDAPAGVFSAGRAMVDDRVIAKVPHPVGSPANYAVRNYLVGRMTQLGLAPQVQRVDAFQERPGKEPLVIGGVVENLIGVLPGKDRKAPALALMAHYDSVPGSPGAADDAAGVSAALEVMRVLKAEGTPARDVVLLLTDGEEAGLLGATGFFQSHPLAKQLGFVINMESRGGGGRANMFETAPANGAVIDLFRKASTAPASSSLIVYLYKQLPNDTDFTVPRKAGIAGLNYAFIARQFDYHSPVSTPENLNQGSLQHLGDEVLATAREAAFAPALPGKAPDKVYANTLGNHLLTYPTLAGWGLLALTLAVMALGVWRARQADAFAWPDVAKGVGAALYLLLTSATLFMLARRVTGAGFGFYDQAKLLANVHLWEVALLGVGIGALLYAAAAVGRGRMRLAAAGLALLAGVLCTAFSGWNLIGLGIGGAGAVVALLAFGRPAGVAGTWTGILGLAFLAALVLQVVAPTAAFLIAWPLAFAALAGAVSAMGTWRPVAVPIVVALLAALALQWVLSFAHGVFIGIDLVEIQALFVWLSALLLWPLIHADPEETRPRTVALIVLAVGFAFVGLVRVIPPWSARHPQPAIITYVVQGATGQSKRFSLAPNAPDWARGVLKADGGHIVKDDPPIGLRTAPGDTLSAWAKPVNPLPPAVALNRLIDGSLEVKITPPAGARALAIDLRPTGKLTDATVNGRPAKILTEPGQWTRIYWQGAAQGVAIGFRAKGPGVIDTRYATTTEAWPADAKPLPKMPPKISGNSISGSTIVTGEQRFTW